MKRIIHFIATAIVLMTACNKTEPAPEQEQYDKYIFFSSGVETKAELIGDKSDLDGESFGVVGYKYPNNLTWDQYKQSTPAPTPNVFYGTGTNTVNVEDVKCDANGLGSYAPLQGWSNTKKYTFFAFYPSPSGNKYVTLVNTTPAIRYSVNTTDLKASMVDLMIDPTSHKDLTSASNGVNNGNVSFNFQHCLSALGINVINSSSATIILKSATISVSGLKYKDLTINLDEGTVSKTSENLAHQSLSLAIPDDGQTVLSNKEDEVSDKLIFIPQYEQGEDVSVEVTVTYTRKLNGYPDFEGEATISGLATKLSQGYKHLVNLKFTESTVVVDEFQHMGWSTIPKVEDTFN